MGSVTCRAITYTACVSMKGLDLNIFISSAKDMIISHRNTWLEGEFLDSTVVLILAYTENHAEYTFDRLIPKSNLSRKPGGGGERV